MKISKPSKSSLKREYLAVQILGEQLVDLTDQQLRSLELDATLLDAVLDAKSIKSHNALRRQKQLIGKLMRYTDPAPIRARLEALGRHGRLQKDAFRQAESWRDRIEKDGDTALSEFIAELGHPNQELTEQTRLFHGAQSDQHRRQALRKIFREIHRELTSKMGDTAS